MSSEPTATTGDKVNVAELRCDDCHHILVRGTSGELQQTEQGVVVRLPSGSEVAVSVDASQQQIVIQVTEHPPDKKPGLAREIDETFARQVAEFIDEYRPALEVLAR